MIIKRNIILIVLMYSIFGLCNLIYKRVFTPIEWLETVGYYGFITLFVLIINLLKRRYIKWAVFILLLFLPLSYLVFTGYNYWDFSSLNILYHLAPVNSPFLPNNLSFKIESKFTDAVITYTLYFLLPICYWYGLYVLSKRLENKLFRRRKEGAGNRIRTD